MSLKEMAKTGRNVTWSQRGMENLGGGFLGLFLLKLIGKSEEKLEHERKGMKNRKPDFFDRLLRFLD